MSTTAVGSSQNGGGTRSIQTNGGALHQSPLWAPSLVQVIQGDIKLEQVQLQDWEEEAFEDKAAEEEELLRVQQEIEIVDVFTPARYRVVKIACSCSEVVLRTTNHTMVYPGSGPSLEVISLHPVV
jgi:hypothetical protein